MFHVNPPSRAITQITTTLIFWGLLLSIAAAQDGDIKTAAQLVKVRKHHDDTVWASEVEAQEYENTFVGLWDSLIHGKDKFAVLREFNFNRINLPQDVKEEAFDHDIVRKQGSTSKAIDRAEFVELLNEFEAAGYKIVETEWHHQEFEPATEDKTASSRVSVLMHVTHEKTNRRFIVRGKLGIVWQRAETAKERRVPDSIDASELYVYEREGDPAFATKLIEKFQCDQTGKEAATTIHPVMIHDLDRDGLPEVIVGGFNKVYWNQGDWKFKTTTFCDFPVRHLNAGVLADFDGDGMTDFVGAGKNDYVYFFKGTNGKFLNPGTPIRAAGKLRIPSGIAAGDISGDGIPDLFVGQQKHGYQNGEIPTPYYDAADSYPSHLLVNDGNGSFRDVTEFAGLGKKARRRNFSSSFVDLDGDHDLDLLLTSDFWGTDFLLNDKNSGSFTDATDSLRPLGFAFGMSHSFGDYNLDGKLDFITIGMSSTTARRLEKMGLGREEFPDYNQARMKMGYGNRLFLRDEKGFSQADFSDTCARTGWSWGSTTLDFDLDGDQDIYVVNGQTSGKTTKDYCTRFWCHDIYYKKGERPDQAIQELFTRMQPLFSGNAISWNGYEHNALLMNLDGTGFVNIGFLMNCSFEFDSRTTVCGDLDADGRVDLLVEHSDRRTDQRNLYFVRNEWKSDNHWVGVKLRPKKGVPISPLGAKAEVTMNDGRKLVQHYATGHSVWAQHPNWLHFGLGKDDSIKQIEVIWPGGKRTKADSSAIDQYHVVSP